MAASSSTLIDLSSAMHTAPVPPAAWLIVLPVLLPLFSGALLLALRHRMARRFGGGRGPAGMISLGVLALTALAAAGLLAAVLESGPQTMVMGRWLPPFGIAFTADALGASFALAAALITLLAVIFMRGEEGPAAPAYGAEPFILLLLSGVSGAFLTGDLFNLYVWFEVLLIASFGLLALGPDKPQLDAALKYGFLNLAGTTLFLVAVGLTYGLTGTLNMADLAERFAAIAGATVEGAVAAAPGLPVVSKMPLVTLTALFLFAFCMKAAAFPLQAWLPASYHTPRASTAGLFAALLTKVGVYAILRVLAMLLPTPLEELSLLLAMVAAATMLFGALATLAERDMRRLPGFVLISGIGTMLAGIALNSPGGTTGAIFYALQSMVLMLALYLSLFTAARLAGGPDMATAGGLYDRHPLFSGLVLALFFAASGLPPFSGFWPKALIVKAALDIGAWWLAGAVLLSGFLLTVGLARAFLVGFMRPVADKQVLSGSSRKGSKQPPPTPATPVRLSVYTRLPLAVLGLAVLAAGLWPEPLMQLAGKAEAGLSAPNDYVRSVFPSGNPGAMP